MESVIIEIGGQKRRLRFDENAVSLFEEAVGMSIGTACKDIGQGTVRALLWAGMCHDDRSLRRDRDEALWRVGEWMSKLPGTPLERSDYCMKFLKQALLLGGYMPEEKNGTGGTEMKTEGGPGFASGASPSAPLS